MQKVSGWVEQGNVIVSIAGTGYTSSNKVQGSFPGATITVYLAGTLTLASIFADNLATPTSKANPFTAGNDGSWSFYVANGLYDIKFSGGGILIPYTLGAVPALDPLGGGATPGAVLMIHDAAGVWSVFDPSGNAINITGTSTQGFQEGYNYAFAHKYPFFVYGCGITHDEIAKARIFLSVPFQSSAGEEQYVQTFGVDMVYIGDPSLDMLIFDTMDISEFHFGGQIIYPGNANVVRLLPTNTLNTGGFIGMTSSTLHFHSLVVTDGTGAPDPTHGGILRATCAGAPIVGMTITIEEAQGGINQILVDNPTASVSTSFTQNNITCTQLHNFSGIGICVGTSTTHATQLAGNMWKAIINAGVSGSTCVSTYGVNELYQISLGGDIGIVQGTSASLNLFLVSRNVTNTMWTDNSTAKNAIRVDPQAGINGYTPTTFANLPNPPHTGMHATITNSNTNTWGANAAGGGSFVVGVFYNGSAWTVESK